MTRGKKAGSTNFPLVQMLRGIPPNSNREESDIFSFVSFDSGAEWRPEIEMSGGDRKKRTPRGTGWEEAGGEFFQESYPGAELDLEALPRDPHYFATLLPSKQTRAATTRKPSKVDYKTTYRRRTSTRQRNTNTMGQNTMPNDIHVAMMPDLSENLANEETTWEEMMLIKAMPVTMAQKREIKAKLLSADTFRLQGLSRFKWRRRQLWEYLKARWKELHKRFELWRGSFQAIESRFGPSVATFFIFVKWLALLNLATSSLLLAFIVIPTVILQEDEEECVPSNGTMSIACCTQRYLNTSFTPPSVYQIIEGNGRLEHTQLFYGSYPYSLLRQGHYTYNLPIAYMTTIIIIYALHLFAIVKAGSAGFKEKLLEGEGQYYKFCSLVFSSWDFCLRSDKGASAKHKALFLEMKEWIEEERREEDVKNQTRDEFCRMLLVRLSMNLLVVAILAAAGCLVYFAIQLSVEEQGDFLSEEYRLLLGYAPSMCIVGLNLVVPVIIQYLGTLEGYSPVNTMRVNLFRHIVLRFSTLGVLLISVSLVKCDTKSNDCDDNCAAPLCWESFIGQQFYKLLALNTLVQIAITFLVNFPRTLLAKHVRCKLARVVGVQEFDTVKHLVDVIYVQLLAWSGSFFTPLLPLEATVVLIMMFYLKKFACLVNSVPSTTLNRVSKSWSLYLFVLLFTFVAVLIPLGYTLATVQPSKTCGPFRGSQNYWSIVENTYGALPDWVRNALTIVTSSAVAFPIVVFLFLLLYYYYILTMENRQMVIVLKKQLVLEGHDKQFLLNRLSAFIKQHQERHKPARSIDPPPANSA